MSFLDRAAATTTASSAPASATNPPLRRLVVRDLPYHQSSNSLRIRHQSQKPLRFYHWYVEDWFHVALRLRTAVSIFLFVLLWTTFLLIFSAIYHAIDRADPTVNCGLGVPPDSITFYTACEYYCDAWFVPIDMSFRYLTHVHDILLLNSRLQPGNDDDCWLRSAQRIQRIL